MGTTNSRHGALAGLDVFIGGPIQHTILPNGPAGHLQDAISTAIRTVRAADGNVFSAHAVEEFSTQTAAITPDQVSVRDYRWMRKCDVFVPVLPLLPDRTLHRTDATHVELGWATAMGRPVVLVTTQPFVESASHLLKGLHRIGAVHALDFDEFTDSPGLLVTAVLEATRQQREAVGARISA
ncbi:nucleoside 2-deoxyribosyltransferase [Streptomyces klenkii]